ncbi:2-succinyl-5-enolpyruvyl-6-hydroxy-3-cyclohexene-1-carboxylate synthase [Bisgaardia hudsonensis]|uniref:2-succinyl-5-enolpyruvyl-6-hydroxy-3-cyclohexene-1-carboxylate synthase n=1 Tax=Bisgaardia hudsonensis TaxID=109472 RepID=A0A4R2N2A2_9PAST|nr:2-succinyl-5-enolpyruvyl-6-hydroxy-3-cyclohexene-1-carboxylic-acid synthase [Bisgaardia hudsonensis]QLB12395.1 2-succinyl-5-enolpyruvyl-6-hydroxy-3-cyclohexene-1-carboxylic-acid synthase [Bisgaardia hudsonensis]TCP13922.1 2-succinyl-5-enolpyruvyl-6-hydroxy-3-cyclohexene-1-carboxylate synthase [Bisgaardia hudsonensis]
MSISVFNRCWAKVILETLVRQGVSHFCIAPGSRSTPLTLEANRLQDGGKVVCHTHFDERGLGFFALGLSKSIKQKVAIIVTSGTATANLYPAIIEARQTGVNLIVLTADRPLELLECGANQAILQENMFANYPIAAINLPRPSQDYNTSWLISIIDNACYKQEQESGVIHINVPFAEPLYEAKNEEIDFHPWLSNIQRWLAQNKKWVKYQSNQHEVLMHENWDHWRTQKGIIVVGRLPIEQAIGIKDWANTMGWIMITDIQSTVEPNLPHADIWLANETIKQKLLQADILIQLGTGFISKRINQFLSTFKNEFWIVDSSNKVIDPYHHSSIRFNAKIHHWLRAHPPLRQKPWLIEPLALANFCTKFIEEEVSGNLNEASLAYYIGRILPKNSQLFLGNSLFVRLADALAKLPDGYPVYTNRGASGIDGLLATISGISIGTEKITVAMLGDLSALYDLNSFALLKKLDQPTVIFIINNNGGAIFDMLPVDESVKEQYYRMPHNVEFSQVATMFDLKYARPYTWADLSSVLKTAYIRKETTIIEIKVNPSDGSNIYKRLIEQISYAVIGS